MNKYRLFRRGVFALILVTTIDIVVGRSVYHPIVHLYRLVSWGICQSSLHNCEYTSTPSEPGQAAVSTSHHEATQVGIDILNEGGNAVDAAVAVGYALAVVHPCCGNLGGGGFMTIHLADGTNIFINFRETAPLASTPQLYQDDEGNVISNLSTQGYLAAAVPGTVAGLEHALANYGSRRIERERLIQPAQHLAESGFTLSAAGQRLLKNQANRFKQEPNVSDIFLKQGKPFSEGDRLTQPDLARTLGLIADEGEEVFYRGEIAQKIVTASEENGGILSMEDFSNYRVQESTPLTCDYRSFTVITTPLPGGGPVVCEILNIVEGYPIGQSEYQSAQHLHWMLSAMLFAYRDRNLYFGDPNFSEIPLDTLLSKEYAGSLRTQIPESKAVQLNRAIPAITEGQNTTHFSVVDKEGNAVSVTFTINTLFGAGVIASDTGFFLNNEMDDFTAKVGSANSYGLQQGVANQIEPGKRPLSSMAPTVVLDDTGSVYAVTGSPGGATIPTTVVQVLSNLIDFEMPLDKAVNQPRLHYQGQPNVVLVEPAGLPRESFIDLWEYGYRVSPFINWGAAMSIGQTGDQLQASQDNRRGQGKAATLPE
ncbi:MAG: gamma-glutamyltransferase [Cyanobacteria bacterium P01_F01_bin.86]